MEEQPIEEKLKLEKDIQEARRQYKLLFNQVQDVKTEYNSIIDAIERNKKLLEENKKYLAEVVKDISQAKLNWVQEKEEEWKKVNDKLAEAENVIKRKEELNLQEQKLRDIEQGITDKVNEHRRLELANEQHTKLLEAEKRQLELDKKKVVAYGKKVEKDKEQFKEELTHFVQQWQTK